MYHVLKNVKPQNFVQNILMFPYGMFITAFTKPILFFFPFVATLF